MNTMKRSTICLLLTVISLSAFAQDTIHFNKGLMVNAPNRFGREAIYTDQLAYQLFNGTLKKPADGAAFSDTLKWQAINADSLNRFRMRGGFGGGSQSYLYLTYNSPKEKAALLNVQGNSGVFVNGEPHAGDPYRSGWLYIPVKLKKGLNEIYIRGGFVTADLIFPSKPVSINTQDPTLPFIVAGHQNNELHAAVVLINTSPKELKGLQLKAVIGGKEITSNVPLIAPMSTRKVIVNFDGSSVTQTGTVDCAIALVENGKAIDEKKLGIESVEASAKYSKTFVSDIDGSLQYYAVTPQSPSPKENAALFLSVHGAGVEAIGQARAYQPKDWGTLVAATNRRPRGFNWEDWGRLDALEVLRIAQQTFKPDPRRIYLTGHSMGGHGTWFLGATYPDKWAAIAPCAGYPTLKGYGSADGLIPDSSRSPIEQMLLRGSNQSDVLQLVNNYKPLGVYIFHGDDDRTVSVRYARQMRKALGDFHTDLSYYEYPGGSHWFGDHSVDWKPLFDFFKWHTILPDTAADIIDFTTASPGISASYRWATIHQQLHPLQFSRIQLNRNERAKTITGTTENVRVLKLDLAGFGNNQDVSVRLDNQEAITVNSTKTWAYLQKENNKWTQVGYPGGDAKGPVRYGTFKDPFNHRMVFVYGTTGTKEENEWSLGKARFDAETWYYRGNGAVDLIADKDYTPKKYDGRNVIIYGNASTNAAWNMVLPDCPIRVERNLVTVGNDRWEGDDIGAYFTYPVKGSYTSIGVVAGSGLKGMNAAHANQYFAGASGFPDFMIFRLHMLQAGADGVLMAGFFDNNWKLSESELVRQNKLISRH
jgi:pimeloyl-ACP methyl ester carboxylesterase